MLKHFHLFHWVAPTAHPLAIMGMLGDRVEVNKFVDNM